MNAPKVGEDSAARSRRASRAVGAVVLAFAASWLCSKLTMTAFLALGAAGLCSDRQVASCFLLVSLAPGLVVAFLVLMLGGLLRAFGLFRAVEASLVLVAVGGFLGGTCLQGWILAAQSTQPSSGAVAAIHPWLPAALSAVSSLSWFGFWPQSRRRS